MQSQVNLQDPFSYSFGNIVIVFLLLLVCVAIYFVFKHLDKPKKKKEEVKIEIQKPFDINEAKNKSISELNKLEKEYSENKVSYRNAYVRISGIIRSFIFDATKIKVQNYTLQEIEKLNMPVLTNLMNEYYKPEFAYNEQGNVIESINKTREAIRKWS